MCERSPSRQAAASSAADRNAIAVTGLGLVTALGSASQTWEALVHGRSAIRELRRFEVPAARSHACADIPDLQAPAALRVPKHAKFMSRSTLCGMNAAFEALAPVGDVLPTLDPYRIALAVGSGETGLDLEEFFPALSAAWQDDAALDYGSLGGPASRLVDPYFSLRTLSNGVAALAAIELGLHGETFNFVHGPVASACALAEACLALREDRADLAIVIGCDALVNVVTWLAWDRGGRLSRLDAARACRPFDADRDGAVLGEAGAALVLERLDDARRRGATVLGRIAGVGFAADGVPFPDVEELPGPLDARAHEAMILAMDEALSAADEVPVMVVAFGEASLAGDCAEAAGLGRRFGRQVPVTAHTGATGFVGAATSLLQSAIALLALRRATIPPIARLERPDAAVDIDVVHGEPRTLDVPEGASALCLSRSFTGQHAAILVAAAS